MTRKRPLVPAHLVQGIYIFDQLHSVKSRDDNACVATHEDTSSLVDNPILWASTVRSGLSSASLQTISIKRARLKTRPGRSSNAANSRNS